MPQMKSEDQLFTYQTRLQLNTEDDYVLFACADLMSQIQRNLFADTCRGKSTSALKSEYLQRFQITARQFNAIRIELEGKIASIKELRKNQIVELKQQIASIEKTIAAQKRASAKLHGKKRRFQRLQAKLKNLENDEKEGRVRLCFGSRKLFRAQFSLESNGLQSHQEWRQSWERARSDSFFLVGSKDETAGNQSCTASLQDDGALTLRLRVPKALESSFGKYIQISNVRFAYGHDIIVASLRSCAERKLGCKECGVAISYRFKRDEKGWLLFASTAYKKPVIQTRAGIGVIGVDINSDHLAVCETDRFNNCVSSKKIPLVLYGKSTSQAKALIGDAIKELVRFSLETKKPLCVEKLAFQEKKTQLREEANQKQARMLSSFAYSSIIEAIKSRSYRFGVEVHEVNPAYTSIIGEVKFAKRYGLSTHVAAAFTIARRVEKASERLPRLMGIVPDGKGGHVTFPLPVRNRRKHVWSQWRRVKKKLTVVRAAHFRANKVRSSSRAPPAC